MEFCIEKHSFTPVAKQIEEQIKIAVMMGVFRKGDTLPSIRDIERQTGINRSQIHKAYLNLRRSGLLVLTRGKGSIITGVSDHPQTASENCRKLSKMIVSRARQLGISPTAFARYLSRHAQESERVEPFLVYLDMDQEIAEQTASEISRLWQVPVMGMEFRDLATSAGRKTGHHRFLVNHLMFEEVSAALRGRKSAVIPVEVRYTAQTIRKLGQIKPNTSVQIVLLPHPSHRIQFMTVQLQKLMKSPGVKISTVFIDGDTDFRKLLSSREFDYSVVGPALLGKIPHDMRRDSHIVPLEAKLDPASLEAARIRAGVVI
jgi:GntR family transcriptional regulator